MASSRGMKGGPQQELLSNDVIEGRAARTKAGELCWRQKRGATVSIPPVRKGIQTRA
jgi:hypothetical protein